MVPAGVPAAQLICGANSKIHAITLNRRKREANLECLLNFTIDGFLCKLRFN